jgi:hypothetical protein
MISLKLSSTRTAKVTHQAMSKCTINLNLQAFLHHNAVQLQRRHIAIRDALTVPCEDTIPSRGRDDRINHALGIAGSLECSRANRA